MKYEKSFVNPLNGPGRLTRERVCGATFYQKRSEIVWPNHTLSLNVSLKQRSHRVSSVRNCSNYRSRYFHSHHCTRGQSNKYGQDDSWDYLHRNETSKTSCSCHCAV